MSAAQPGELREALAEALDKAIRNRRGPMTTQSYADALLPVVTAYAERLARERAAEEIESAHEYARAATRQGFAEGRGEDFTRHWAATAGWLKHWRDELLAGREPDWPDAAYSDTPADDQPVQP